MNRGNVSSAVLLAVLLSIVAVPASAHAPPLSEWADTSRSLEDEDEIDGTVTGPPDSPSSCNFYLVFLDRYDHFELEFGADIYTDLELVVYYEETGGDWTEENWEPWNNGSTMTRNSDDAATHHLSVCVHGNGTINYTLKLDLVPVWYRSPALIFAVMAGTIFVVVLLYRLERLRQ